MGKISISQIIIIVLLSFLVFGDISKLKKKLKIVIQKNNLFKVKK
jgi:Sec-independent protein translocase protein TatA